MAKKSHNLETLLITNPGARAFFDELPDYVREHIRSRGNNVKTFDALQDYAENLLRGEG
ncbi:MAG TPA: hypothetical protein GX701_03165 [Clostridiales bacterium]|jgi:hypothetical protein|nr:hypothetical protein [Clostridiales bacterium]